MKNIPDTVKTIITNRCNIGTDRITIDGQLNYKEEYLPLKKFAEDHGGKWNRKAGAIVFAPSDIDRLKVALNNGSYVDEKQELQAFYSPWSLATRMAKLLDIQNHNSVFEPSAGGGALVKAVVQRAKADLTPIRLSYCEINERMWPEIDLVANGGARLGGDFMELSLEHTFDRIIANPPFTKGQDVDHVTKMYKHLKPGGVLVAITSPGWRFRKDKRHTAFRKFIEDNGAWVENLEEGTFKDAGTQVKTVLVVITKPEDQS